MSVTIILVAITCVISFIAFSNQKLMDDLIFYPPAISERNQWYRFITCGFIHADIAHLFFNMFALYMFGDYIERAFSQIFGDSGSLLYILLYITSLFACLLPTYMQHKDNYYYRSLGASGAVSAVVFAFMFLFPSQGIGLFFIPVFIPGFIFGPIYLIISSILAKRGGSHINHSAHFWGAVYGVLFLIVTSYALSDFDLVGNFIAEVKGYFASF
ncbi:MAG: rhomboid family intramembrane serine protease [Ilyomonas sp.]